MFTCNVCGTRCDVEPAELGRDVPSCPTCGSRARDRAVMLVLSTTLFGRSISVPELPSRPDLRGIGLTDLVYDSGLAAKLGYTNTYYHREPRLDITDPPEELHGSLDFLISSDVLEHVLPPVERAIEGSFRLLKPGGILLLTVPHSHEQGETFEHFTSPREHRALAEGRWDDLDGVRFHKGPGLTVEMRMFATSTLLAQLRAAGFEDITEWTEEHPEHGIVGWEYGWPLVARRPA